MHGFPRAVFFEGVGPLPLEEWGLSGMVRAGAGGGVALANTARCRPRNTTNVSKATDGGKSETMQPDAIGAASANNVARPEQCVATCGRLWGIRRVLAGSFGPLTLGFCPEGWGLGPSFRDMWPKPGRIGPDWTMDNDTTASGNPCRRLEAARPVFYAR